MRSSHRFLRPDSVGLLCERFLHGHPHLRGTITIVPKPCPKCNLINKATGRSCSRSGAILDVQTAGAMQDEIEGLDGRF